MNRLAWRGSNRAVLGQQITVRGATGLAGWIAERLVNDSLHLTGSHAFFWLQRFLLV
jgi:hypothetical protein